MKTINASLSIEVDDGVSPDAIKAVLSNHLYWCPWSELGDGNVRWDRIRIFVGEGRVSRATVTK